VIQFDNARTEFREKVTPDELVNIDLTVEAPAEPGRYLIEIDLVKEYVAWFKERGSETVQLPFVVLEPTSTKKG